MNNNEKVDQYFKEVYQYFEEELPLILADLPLGEEGKKVGIYGLGVHTERLLEKYTYCVGDIKVDLFFIDSYKLSFEETYKGYDVYNVKDIGGRADCIIISSSLYEKAMYKTIKELYADSFKIYRFYEDAREDIFMKNGIYIPNNIKELPKLKINIVDFYRSFDKKKFFLYPFLFKEYQIEISDRPDILFCSQYGKEHENYEGCKKVLIMYEPWTVDYGEYDYVIGYPYIEKDSYFHFNVYAPRWADIQDRKMFMDNSLAQRRFCNFIYSNESASYEGAQLRKQFCLELSKYKRIDCPGKVLNNMENSIGSRYADTWGRDKLELIKNYKFTIAFENSKLDGYTTEKLWQPFYAGSIPIYWGNPLIGTEVCKDAFINCNDYDNDLEAVIERVKEIDNDDEYYMYMLSKAPLKDTYHYVTDEEIMGFLRKIICDKSKYLHR